jgi:hypothetical protein
MFSSCLPYSSGSCFKKVPSGGGGLVHFWRRWISPCPTYQPQPQPRPGLGSRFRFSRREPELKQVRQGSSPRNGHHCDPFSSTWTFPICDVWWKNEGKWLLCFLNITVWQWVSLQSLTFLCVNFPSLFPSQGDSEPTPNMAEPSTVRPHEGCMLEELMNHLVLALQSGDSSWSPPSCIPTKGLLPPSRCWTFCSRDEWPTSKPRALPPPEWVLGVLHTCLIFYSPCKT